MKLFIDTPALFKLYHREEGTTELMDFFQNNAISAIYLAEIAEIEFSSAIWKKCRKEEIDKDTSRLIIEKFKKDSERYRFITQNYRVRKTATQLIAIYRKDGLRSLDSTQLASAISVKESVDLFITSDNILSKIAIHEGLNTKM